MMNQDGQLNPQKKTQPLGKDSSATFQPPRHWVGVEELDPAYWADEKIQTKRGQEFFDKPIETLEEIEKSDSSGLARREFLTIMGASMALAGTACVRRPVRKIVPYVMRPAELTPGVALHYATTVMMGTTAVGLLVKTREGRPIKLEGNPDYPTNKGKLSANQQATLLSLYDPDRLTEPTRVKKGEGPTQKITWDIADAEISAALASARKSGKKIRLLMGSRRGPATQALLKEAFGAFSDVRAVEFFPHQFDDLSQVYSAPTQMEYQLEHAEVVVSFGGDFLGTLGDPVQQAMGWAKGRKLSSQSGSASAAKMSKLWVFESQLSVTGSNADARVALKPGDEWKVAAALANALKSKGLALAAGPWDTLNSYQPEAVEKETGVAGLAGKLKEVASELLRARGQSAVVAGGLVAQSAEASWLQALVASINAELNNFGKTVFPLALFPSGNFAKSSGYQAISELISEMAAGQVGVLITVGTNPVYHLPPAMGWNEAVTKAELVVALADRVDESAVYSDMVLPLQHYLESWGDAVSANGVISVQQPTLAPLHASRSLEDNLMAWAKAKDWGVSGRLKESLSGKMLVEPAPQAIVGPKVGSAAVPETTPWYDYLASYWKSEFYPRFGRGRSFQKFWEETLALGLIAETANSQGTSTSFKSSSLDKLPRLSADGEAEGFYLTGYETVGMADGAQANNPWLQELPDPISTITWDNFVNLSPEAAKQLKVQQDEVVVVTGEGFSFELPVNIQPGLHAQAVTVPVGYGRTRSGKIGNKVGFNFYSIGKWNGAQPVFCGLSVKLKKTGKYYRLAATQWHNTTESRPVINDITLAEYKADPKSANHTDPHLRMATPTMWTKHEYPGYRWGMSIDLTSCIGCTACVIACQAENNIPVVGRDNVRRSREMHWIRIDRYYSGEANQPDVVFQPMLCQHCENAPCETVCPVLATVHGSEGTNDMAYNRCVGTRYCQNNCPYKVRRFNFFDHWKQYQGTMNMVWNPDVTVRMRGVMEKCSFCIQRIHEVKGRAKDEGRKVKDGEIKTACQQTCPTDAIVFGNMNDASTQVATLMKRPEGFKSLEVLNVQPAITYLSKVRNRDGKMGDHASSSGHGHEETSASTAEAGQPESH